MIKNVRADEEQNCGDYDGQTVFVSKKVVLKLEISLQD
jgi:hypothetical protein